MSWRGIYAVAFAGIALIVGLFVGFLFVWGEIWR